MLPAGNFQVHSFKGLDIAVIGFDPLNGQILEVPASIPFNPLLPSQIGLDDFRVILNFQGRTFGDHLAEV